MDTDQPLVLAERAAAVADSTTSTAGRQLVESVAIGTEASGVPPLLAIGETRWLKLLRPIVEARVQAAIDTADELGITEPRDLHYRVNSGASVRRHGHPWSPDPHDLERDITLRHRWERLEEVLAQLDAAYAVADQLRVWGLLPIVDGRTVREDYRWLYLNLMEGTVTPRHPRELWLANYRTAEPGIYSAKEMRGARRRGSRAGTEARTVRRARRQRGHA